MMGYWFGGFSFLKNGRVRNFGDAKGTVTGSVNEAGSAPRELTIGSAQDPRGVVVEVRDSGIGLDQERAERVFRYVLHDKSRRPRHRLVDQPLDRRGARWAAMGGARNQPHGAAFGFALPAAEIGRS